VDAFNFRHGPAPNNHVDVDSSKLMDVIYSFWQRNTARPSNCELKITDLERKHNENQHHEALANVCGLENLSNS
jgi:hypothetical protein